MGNACPVQQSFRVQEVLAFVVQRPRAPARRESQWSASAKAISDLHADGQLRSEHAQVGTYLEVKNLSETEVVEFAQALSEQAGYQQRRR
jgi:hypothetical protein